MATRYQIRIKDTTGVVVTVLVNWRQLRFRRQVNGLDTHVLALDGDLPIVDEIGLDYQIEVWRRDIAASPAIAWYLEYEGFHRTEMRQTTETGLSIFTGFGRGYDDLLRRRVILYPAGSAQAEKSGVGETVMKEFVNENAGPGATSPPRLLASGVTTGLTIQADQAAGGTWEGGRAYRNLLETLQEAAEVTSVDFGVVGTGAATYEFQAKAVPWGDDRSTVGLDPATGLNGAGNPPVIFSLERGNMQSPSYSLSRVDEITAVAVLGQGVGSDRVVVQRTGAGLTGSPWNRAESSRQANTESVTAGLNAVGDALLEESQAKESFSFQVLQTPSSLYGRDYFLGDIVTARYQDIERNYQIMAALLSVAEGREVIDIEVRNIAER